MHALADRDINAAQPGAGNTGRPRTRRFQRHRCYDRVGRVPECELPRVSGVRSNRRFRGGVLLKGAYTFSEVDQLRPTRTVWAALSLELATCCGGIAPLTWGTTAITCCSWAGVADLPFGPGKRFASGGGLGSLLVRDWQANGTFGGLHRGAVAR